MKRLLTIGAAAVAAVCSQRVLAATLGTYSGTVPATNAVMFTGVSLADVKSVSAWFTGKSMGTAGKSAPTTAYHYSNDGSTLTVQFQAYLGDYTKGVALELTQDGADIKGRSIYTGYVNDQYRNYEGTDMAASPWGVTMGGTGYEINNVTLSDEDDSHLRTKLYWNGASGDTWDDATANWLTEAGEATAWVPGAWAIFTNAAAQTVAVAASGVTASHFTMKGWPVTFTGGTLTMVGASEVVMCSGLARFECPIAGVNGFRVANCAYLYALPLHTVIAQTSQTLFRNATLAGISNLYATASGNSVGWDSTAQKPYLLENDGATLTAQMQWYGGGYTKCIFLELTQVGPDICGRVTGGAYINDHFVDCRGVDFRTHPKATNNRLFDGDTAVYGMCDLHLCPRVELAADNTFTGMVRDDNMATLAVTGGTLGGGTFSDPIVIYRATLELSHTHQVLNGGISDSANASTPGTVVIKGTVDPSGGTLTYSGNLPDTTAQRIFQNANLSGWTGLNARFNQPSMSDKNYPWGTPFFFRNDGKTARCQLQVKDDHYVKCAIYEFTQRENDIWCRRVSSHYVDGFSNLGNDFEVWPRNSGSYTCRNLAVAYTNATDTTVTLGAANAYYGGTEIDGALVSLKVVNALPTAEGLVTTLKGGAKLSVEVHAADSNVGVLGKSTVNVTEGSSLRFARFRCNGSQTTVNASGDSEVFIAGGNGNGTQDFGYLTHLSLTDGATVNGDAFRSGYESDQAVSGITVAGTSAAVVEPPIVLLRGHFTAGSTGYGNLWKLNVADVTEGADLYLNGAIANYAGNSGAFAGRPIEKTGAGTVRLGAANSYTGSVSIVDGAILLGTNGAFNANIALTLAGGTLDAGASTNAAGALSVVSNSTIAVSSGAELSFADSSAQDWGSSRLTITGDPGARTLRFGTDGNGLAPEQVRRIRWDGHRVVLGAGGYLAPNDFGIRLIVW
ncbi:MAG: hypothetical protein IKE55_00590 [Kiritimatiellae bacterium]|nr:hypothetical protein [Kiritimatiellia bacterium]